MLQACGLYEDCVVHVNLFYVHADKLLPRLSIHTRKK